MKNFVAQLLTLICLSGCSKTSYILKQAHGQLALEWNARPNEEVLKDKRVTKKIKNKIRQIIEYKKFFYKYFDRKETGIYEETTFLKDKAVSYLVIAAPANTIKPIKVSFPIVGEFPYLGFFSLDDAKDYEKEQQQLGNDTYLRPVYAYSTLNQWIFDDNILSSFFQMDEHELSELVFHELIHTIFFISSEVDFNESLAQFLGERLTEQYFNYTQEDKKQIEYKNLQKQDYAKMISTFAKDMQALYREKKLTDEESRAQLKKYLHEKMAPRFEAFCSQYQIQDCSFIDQKWNNARLAAFLTYQKKQNLIAQIQQKHRFSLKELLVYFEKEYKEFRKLNLASFTKYLTKKYLKTKE